MKVQIHISLKNGVLDPQGKAIENSLINLGFDKVENVRQGKFIELDIDENDVRNISKTSQYRTNYRNNWRETFDTKSTRNTFKYLFNPEKSSNENHNDYRNLVSDITVKFVFNNKYINERRPSLGPVYNNKSKYSLISNV